jgi:hypothetical protein
MSNFDGLPRAPIDNALSGRAKVPNYPKRDPLLVARKKLTSPLDFDPKTVDQTTTTSGYYAARGLTAVHDLRENAVKLANDPSISHKQLSEALDKGMAKILPIIDENAARMTLQVDAAKKARDALCMGAITPNLQAEIRGYFRSVKADDVRTAIINDKRC